MSVGSEEDKKEEKKGPAKKTIWAKFSVQM